MIMAQNAKERARALEKILPMQRDDFVGILREMQGLPVTIRLLDPPLHEFLPKEDGEIRELAAKIGTTPAHLTQVRDSLFEFNPMLGHRGSRLGISYPEIYKAQARAILEAACRLRARGVKAMPEIMLPLIGTRSEFTVLAGEIREVAREVFKETGRKVPFTVGTMIELPRACMVAGEIAKDAEFFSFGTNDLTQMAYGLSRDDSVKFLQRLPGPRNLQEGSVSGARRRGRRRSDGNRGRARPQTNPRLKIGICGEHGGDPASIRTCHRLGLDYVSCSPFRIPIARLSAAQAAIEAQRQKREFKDV